MPFPVALLVPSLILWGKRALITYGLASIFSDASVQELKKILLGHVVSLAASRAGLDLDPDDPVSDASLSNAVGLRLGFAVRSLKDRAMLMEDIDSHMAGEISRRSGYSIRSVSDRAILEQDLMRAGAAQLSVRLGIPAGVIAEDGAGFDADAVKVRLLKWAKAELMAQVNMEVSIKSHDLSVLAINDAGRALSIIQTKGGADTEGLELMQVATALAGQVAVGAVVDFQKTSRDMSKRQRRQEQLRAAQAKFRRAHGNRQVYVPIGLVASFS